MRHLVSQALDSLAVDARLHTAAAADPLPVRLVLQPVVDRNKSYLEGTQTPLGGYGQNYGIGYLPAGPAEPDHAAGRLAGGRGRTVEGAPSGGVFPEGGGALTCGACSQRRKKMAALYDLREELTELLRLGLSGVAVLGEYPGEGKRYPQAVASVAVGIAGAVLEKLDYLGEQEAGEQTGRRWETHLQLELSVPRQAGAGELYRLFDRAAGLLLTYGGRYGLREVECGAVKYLRERDCFALPCTARCLREESELHPGTALTGFEVTRRSD